MVEGTTATSTLSNAFRQFSFILKLFRTERPSGYILLSLEKSQKDSIKLLLVRVTGKYLQG